MRNAKENKTFKSIVKGTFVAGALLGAATLSANNTSSLFNYDVLGSGSEVRSELLHTGTSPFANLDMACGEKAAKETKGKAEAKTKEAKCGEGTCGEKEKAAKTKKEVKGEAKAKSTKAESKAKEAKCGESKCGK